MYTHTWGHRPTPPPPKIEHLHVCYVSMHTPTSPETIISSKNKKYIFKKKNLSKLAMHNLGDAKVCELERICLYT